MAWIWRMGTGAHPPAGPRQHGLIQEYQDQLRNTLSIPVLRPLKGELTQLLPLIQEYMREYSN